MTKKNKKWSSLFPSDVP